VFLDPLAIHREDPDTEDEERFIAVLRGDEIRLISARRATRKEVKDYES